MNSKLYRIMDKNRWKIFKKRLKKFLKQLAPYVIHLAMVVSVAAYVMVGAVAIRRIEAVPKSQTTVNVSDESDQFEENIDAITFLDSDKELLKRGCIISILQLLNSTNDFQRTTASDIVNIFDECYKQLEKNSLYWKTRRKREKSSKSTTTEVTTTKTEWTEWSSMDAILFCFTVITTIGYGNVAPQTIQGRLFVIIYGLIGIPFTMLAIANLGKFLAELLKKSTKPLLDCFRRIHRDRIIAAEKRSKEKEALVSLVNNEKPVEDKENVEAASVGEPEVAAWGEALILFIAFFLYILVGSVVISTYEPEMDFFGSIYFNFVSLTTVGLGDLVPENETYLLFTLIYCAVGLALTTIAIEIAADYLKKLHYFGRKIDNVANVNIWFGGKKLTMKQLVKNLGDQFNLPIHEVADLNLDHFVDAAIRVEAGELATLRQEPVLRPVFLDSDSLLFVDEDEYYQVPPKPTLELFFGQPATKTTNPFVIVNEYATFTATQPILPHNYTAHDNSVETPSWNSLSELRVDALPLTYTSYAVFPDTKRLQRLLLQYIPPKRNSIGSTLDPRAIKKYAQEAMRRYEAYRQEWKRLCNA